MGKCIASIKIVTLAIMFFVAVAMADHSKNTRFSTASQVSLADFPTCVTGCATTGTQCATACTGGGAQFPVCVFTCGFNILTCFVQCAGAGGTPSALTPPSVN